MRRGGAERRGGHATKREADARNASPRPSCPRKKPSSRSARNSSSITATSSRRKSIARKRSLRTSGRRRRLCLRSSVWSEGKWRKAPWLTRQIRRAASAVRLFFSRSVVPPLAPRPALPPKATYHWGRTSKKRIRGGLNHEHLCHHENTLA